MENKVSRGTMGWWLLTIDLAKEEKGRTSSISCCCADLEGSGLHKLNLTADTLGTSFTDYKEIMLTTKNTKTTKKISHRGRREHRDIKI